MKTNLDELVRKAKDALTAVFSYTDVDSKITYEALKELSEEIEILLDALAVP